MGYQNAPESVWELAESQHGVVTRSQLLDFGVSAQAIKHRVSRGRLHPVMRGVYAIGRPELSIHGRWMAAVLSCGSGASLSHRSAAALWQIDHREGARIEVSVPRPRCPRRPAIRVHRRESLRGSDVTERFRIPVTTPMRTLIDVAAQVGAATLESALIEADKRDLIDPEALRAGLADHRNQRGVRALRAVLDRPTFTLTDSDLERRFLSLVEQTDLPMPLTGQHLHGFRVDFFWPRLGLVVETDGLRYHRTPAQQAKDRIRDQTLTAAGLTCLRFTNAQVRFHPERVRATLVAVMRSPSAGTAAGRGR